MINFSSIPPRPSKQWTPWTALKWALLSLLAIFAALGLGALATIHSSNRDNVMASIAGLLVILFFGVIIKGFGKGYLIFKKQKQWMQAFALDNGWYYDDSRRTTNDLEGFPASLGINSVTTKVRCSVTGVLDGLPFELSHITYWQSTGGPGIVMTGMLYRPSWISVLRISGTVSFNKNPALFCGHEGSNSYVINPLNALYADDVRALFECVSADSI